MKSLPWGLPRRPAPCRRALAVEELEDRRLLVAAPWHNAAMPLDVNQSGTITPLDAAAVIADILVNGVRELEPPDPDPPFFYVDTNADNRLTPRDALVIVNYILSPPQVTLSTLAPFSIDVTPIIDVSATSPRGLSQYAAVNLDVDLNNDRDFVDPGEANYTLATLFDGKANFTIAPALPASLNGQPYTVNLRARVTDSAGFAGTSALMPLIIDTEMSDALANYVQAPDASYRYSLASTVNGLGFTYYVLDMTSQTWRSAADVNKPDWRHWVEVIVPQTPLRTTALLLIDGGNNNFGAPPTPNSTLMQSLAQVAIFTQSVFVRLRTVPSEPLVFTDETRNRSEDEIIAYSFDKYLEHIGQSGNETWPVLVAMAKSAVRAMDTIQDFIPTVTPFQINDFAVTGYSKRGWTTWLTAAVDDRVRMILPGVIDVLNQGPQMAHHYGVYGFFSEAIGDYNDMQIFDRIMTPEGQQLSKIVDPYRYLNNGRFEIPKLLLNSAGDEFFVSDSAQFYFHDLPGEDNYLRYFPNTGHGLDESAVTSTLTFYYAVVTGEALPNFSWTVEPDGAIRVQTVNGPTQVLLWQATNPTQRDFRRAWHPEITWTSSALVDQGGGVYIGNPDMPASGARAYFIELTYPSSIPGLPHKFTTEIRVKSTLPLFDWPFDSGFPLATSLAEPALAISPAAAGQESPWDLAAVASALSQPTTVDSAAMESFVVADPAPLTVDESGGVVVAGPCASPPLAEVLALESGDEEGQDDWLDETLDAMLV